MVQYDKTRNKQQERYLKSFKELNIKLSSITLFVLNTDILRFPLMINR